MNNSNKWIQTFVFVVACVGMAVGYQNCGSGSGTGGNAAAATAPDGDITPIANTKTASVQRASRTLDNLVSCMGVGEPRNEAENAFANNRGTISEEGLATTLTQPMAKAMVTIATEVCDQLVNPTGAEVIAQESRDLMFPEIDFGNGGLSRSDLILGAKRLARACWGRNPSSEEIGIIADDSTSAFSAENDDQNRTRNTVLYMCIGMTSSFSTYEM